MSVGAEGNRRLNDRQGPQNLPSNRIRGALNSSYHLAYDGNSEWVTAYGNCASQVLMPPFRQREWGLL